MLATDGSHKSLPHHHHHHHHHIPQTTTTRAAGTTTASQNNMTVGASGFPPSHHTLPHHHHHHVHQSQGQSQQAGSSRDRERERGYKDRDRERERERERDRERDAVNVTNHTNGDIQPTHTNGSSRKRVRSTPLDEARFVLGSMHRHQLSAQSICFSTASYPPMTEMNGTIPRRTQIQWMMKMARLLICRLGRKGATGGTSTRTDRGGYAVAK